MKKITLYSSLAITLLMLFGIQTVFAQSTIGSNLTGVGVTTEDFAPIVWMCDSRAVYDDATAPGRISNDGDALLERINNYAFEGEQVKWEVLVMDKNGIDDVNAISGTAASGTAASGVEVACIEDTAHTATIDASCNAKIGGQVITAYNSDVMRYYNCTLTVETSSSMYGPYWLTVEAEDANANIGVMAEREYWYLNPIIALGIDGTMEFTDAIPGADSYSDSIVISNDADDGSGVMMDMFISGTDFYDTTSTSGVTCPTTNQLPLSAFRYYATNGAYSTLADDEEGQRGAVAGDDRDCDAEGYCNIGYGVGFNNPTPFYEAIPGNAIDDAGGFEIIQDGTVSLTEYWPANLLAQGANMAVTFKLSLPQPCNGDFDSGNIYFWGEAI